MGILKPLSKATGFLGTAGNRRLGGQERSGDGRTGEDIGKGREKSSGHETKAGGKIHGQGGREVYEAPRELRTAKNRHKEQRERRTHEARTE